MCSRFPAIMESQAMEVPDDLPILSRFLRGSLRRQCVAGAIHELPLPLIRQLNQAVGARSLKCVFQKYLENVT
ncbi:hypothetical protein THTE_2921 [Thermogutta terrifontis]|uniref:Uncharacterized protein n=1 Tax=Thermogutta terrifontis TaxID=1331910 RepID=A0A286RHU2_9BACT|nr:hypothetical protein THTE_2921 [Thermogutta terrifontis]